MSTSHLSEDDLVLHYYGEMAVAQENLVTAHLAHCDACRTEYGRLKGVLDLLDETALAPNPPPGFERTVWARLEPNLHPGRRARFAWLLSPAPLALAATVLALVAASFLAGRALSRSTSPTVTPSAAGTATDAPNPDPIRERILIAEVGEHLDRSQMALVELVSAGAQGNIDMATERTRAAQLVANNRLYRRTAEQTGNIALSELLDDIERVLTEVAASSDTASSGDLADVRRRIESRDLLFKIRVVASEIREREHAPVVQRTGPSS